MKTETLFPLVDHPTKAELTALGVTKRRHVKAQYSGEFRQPQGGEWYLSGAIVEAYRASKPLHGDFHIARLVKTT